MFFLLKETKEHQSMQLEEQMKKKIMLRIHEALLFSYSLRKDSRYIHTHAHLHNKYL